MTAREMLDGKPCRAQGHIECVGRFVAIGLSLAIAAAGCADAPDTVAEGPEAVEAETAAAQTELSSVLASTLVLNAIADSGPYGFARREFVFVDRSRPTRPNNGFPGAPSRTLPTVVWYPAKSRSASPPGGDRAPVAHGRFPLLAYGHGFASPGGDARPYAEHLASHGYIVAAPLFPLTRADAPGGPTSSDYANQPADLEFVMQQIEGLDGADADLARAVLPDHRGVFGFSAGGLTALLAAYHPVLQIDVRSAVAYAPASCFLGPATYGRALPVTIVSGTADELAPIVGPLKVFDQAPPPVTLVKLLGGNHTGFLNMDIPDVENTDTVLCELVQSMGGISGGSEQLFEDLTRGVGPGAVDPGGCDEFPFCGTRFTQTMEAARQLTIARAVTLAHFDATLKGRLLRVGLVVPALEAAPDVVLKIKR
ncbi:uncharacterized protein SOCE836_046970 [Sorangium cellulosum]|uniref:Uncharacterized protein n=2 Tax=Polyangiaceae TaxID=49 RepID=A0A4P2QRB2_SORCE|nr:uncharacterized protein SOCE836_046970 [Sorangium cellulosum]WCQ91930.1 hypothetical protein NQZ70_04657 [Sorangium sp. Soce836]